MASKNRTTGASSIQFIFYLAVVSLICIGCGQGNSIKLSSTEAKAFETASPEVKKVWESALAADKATDYVNGQKLFSDLAQMPLNDLQKQALEKQSSAFALRLLQAAEKNDPVAVKVIQESQGGRRRMPPVPGK